MKKAISKINPFRYAKKLHIGYIWLIAVLLLLVVGVICSGAKVYKYSPILSVVSYSLAAISLIAIIIMIVRKTSDMKIQSELDKYILVLNEHKDDQEWLHKELTYVNLRIYNKTNGHLYRCKKKLLEEYKNEANNIIGHFGLGFYSSFMVSNKVDVISKSFKEDSKGVKWSCDGSPEFTMEDD